MFILLNNHLKKKIIMQLRPVKNKIYVFSRDLYSVFNGFCWIRIHIILHYTDPDSAQLFYRTLPDPVPGK